jgi:F-type H+-transporting ATPase subunit b
MHFDWSTLVLQTVNVLVLLWLLRRFLFRPVVAIIAARKDAADKLLADADSARAQAQQAAAQAAQHEQSLAADGEHIRAEAHAVAAAERTTLLDHATQEAADLRAAALAGLERDRTRMRQELQHEAGTLALTIASRLVARIPTPALNAALLQSLDTWLATLPPDRLGTVAPPGETLEVVTAAPLDPQGQQTCQAMLNERFSRPPSIRFATDPALIAGVELRGPHGTLRNNWRADLDRIAQELSQDDDQRALA